MLQTMINSIVRLSAPAGSPAGMYSGLTALLTYPGPPTHCACSSRICSMHENSKATAGGKASETASLARPNTKKRKKRPGKEPGRVSHGSTQDGGALASEQTVLESTNETSRPADSQQKPKLGKRKGIEQSAPQARQEHPSTRSEARPLPASHASQEEGSRKRSKTQKSRGQGLGREVGHGRKGMTQDGASLPTVAAAAEYEAHPQQSHGDTGRGKSSQPDAQQRLRSSPAQDSAPTAQAPEPVRRKRSRNKFKQDSAADQSGLPKDVVSAPGAQAPEAMRKKQSRIESKQIVTDNKSGLPMDLGSAPAAPAPEAVRKKRNRNKFKQADGASQPVLPESLLPEVAAHQSLQDDAAATLGTVEEQNLAAKQRTEPAPAPLQHDEQLRQPSGKQMKGNARGHKDKAAVPTLKSTNAGKTKEGDLASGSQIARAGVKGQKEDGLLGKMRAKLAGSQFRWLNEQLYTCPGSQAFELMQEQPQLFTQYHEVRALMARLCFHLVRSRLSE